MGKWLPFDPNPDDLKDSVYANEQLNTMMKSYLENQEQAKIFHEHRKNELVRQNILDNLTSRQENLKELQDKIQETTNLDEKNKLKLNLKSIEEQIKNMDEKKNQIDKELEDLDNKIKLFTSKNQTKLNDIKIIN